MSDVENSKGIYCDECDEPVDSEGYTLSSDDCNDWRHPSDCATCGASYCDSSC